MLKNPVLLPRKNDEVFLTQMHCHAISREGRQTYNRQGKIRQMHQSKTLYPFEIVLCIYALPRPT